MAQLSSAHFCVGWHIHTIQAREATGKPPTWMPVWMPGCKASEKLRRERKESQCSTCDIAGSGLISAITLFTCCHSSWWGWGVEMGVGAADRCNMSSVHTPPSLILNQSKCGTRISGFSAECRWRLFCTEGELVLKWVSIDCLLEDRVALCQPLFWVRRLPPPLNTNTSNTPPTSTHSCLPAERLAISERAALEG